MRSLYSLVLYLLSPYLLGRLVVRGFRNRQYWYRWRERLGFIDRIDCGKLIWVHAVSVGEVNAAIPLIEGIRRRSPHAVILVTTMTPTGSDRVRQLVDEKIQHCYSPYDFPGAVRRFWQRSRPDLVVIMETEIWPNMLHVASRSATPVFFSNVRMSEISMRGYLRLHALTTACLKSVSGFAVQTEADAERMRRLGARTDCVHVTGSIKFELTVPQDLERKSAELRKTLGEKRFVWVAGSTRQGEEEQLLEVFDCLRQKHENLLLIIAPRHPERFQPVFQKCEKAGFKCQRRSERQRVAAETEIYIADTMGELLHFYAAADLAFVGGSLVATGGHNLLEACVVGTPVLFGPHMFNFSEIARLTSERQAGVEVAGKSELFSQVSSLLGDSEKRRAMGAAGRELVAENKGALKNTLTLLESFLP